MNPAFSKDTSEVYEPSKFLSPPSGPLRIPMKTILRSLSSAAKSASAFANCSSKATFGLGHATPEKENITDDPQEMEITTFVAGRLCLGKEMKYLGKD